MLMSAARHAAPRPARAPLAPPPRRTECGEGWARSRTARAHACVYARVARARVPRQRVAGARAPRARRGRARSAACALRAWRGRAAR
jgi:hypothetical protein